MDSPSHSNTVTIDLRVTEWVPVVLKKHTSFQKESKCKGGQESCGLPLQRMLSNTDAPPLHPRWWQDLLLSDSSSPPPLSWYPSYGGFTFIPTRLLHTFFAPNTIRKNTSIAITRWDKTNTSTADATTTTTGGNGGCGAKPVEVRPKGGLRFEEPKENNKPESTTESERGQKEEESEKTKPRASTKKAKRGSTSSRADDEDVEKERQKGVVFSKAGGGSNPSSTFSSSSSSSACPFVTYLPQDDNDKWSLFGGVNEECGSTLVGRKRGRGEGSGATPSIGGGGVAAADGDDEECICWRCNLEEGLPFSLAAEGSVPRHAVFRAIESFIMRALESASRAAAGSRDANNACDREEQERGGTDGNTKNRMLLFLGDGGIYLPADEGARDSLTNVRSGDDDLWRCLHGCSIRVVPQMNPISEIIDGDRGKEEEAAATRSGEELLAMLMEGAIRLRTPPTFTVEFTPLLRRYQWFELPMSVHKQSILSNGGIVVDGSSEESSFIVSNAHIQNGMGGVGLMSGGEGGIVASALFEDNRAVVVPSLADVRVVAVSQMFPYVDVAKSLMCSFPRAQEGSDDGDRSFMEADYAEKKAETSPCRAVQHQREHCNLHRDYLGPQWAPPYVSDQVWCLLTYPPAADWGSSSFSSCCGGEDPLMKELRIRRRCQNMAEMMDLCSDKASNVLFDTDGSDPLHCISACSGRDDSERQGQAESEEAKPHHHSRSTYLSSSSIVESLARAVHLVPSGRLWRLTSLRRGWSEITPTQRASVGAVIELVLSSILQIGVSIIDKSSFSSSSAGVYSSAPVPEIETTGQDSIFFNFFSLPSEREQLLYNVLQDTKKRSSLSSSPFPSWSFSDLEEFGNGGVFLSAASSKFGVGAAFSGFASRRRETALAPPCPHPRADELAIDEPADDHDEKDDDDELDVATRLISYCEGRRFLKRLFDDTAVNERVHVAREQQTSRSCRLCSRSMAASARMNVNDFSLIRLLPASDQAVLCTATDEPSVDNIPVLLSVTTTAKGGKRRCPSRVDLCEETEAGSGTSPSPLSLPSAALTPVPPTKTTTTTTQKKNSGEARTGGGSKKAAAKKR